MSIDVTNVRLEQNLNIIRSICTNYESIISKLEKENQDLRIQNENIERKYAQLKNKIEEKRRKSLIAASEIASEKNDSPSFEVKSNSVDSSNNKKPPNNNVTSKQASVLKEIKRKYGFDEDDNKKDKVKYEETVRTKADRQKMHAGDCPCCSGYYKATEDVNRPKSLISRHRTLFPPKNTPAGFWDIGFQSSSQE